MKLGVLAPLAIACCHAAVEPTPSTAPSASEGAWARVIPSDPKLETHAVPEHGSVVVTWRVGPPLPAPKPCDDATEALTLDLVVTSGDAQIVVPLGAVRGAPHARNFTYCKRKDEHAADRWDIPEAPGIASTFVTEIYGDSNELILVRDGAVLHVLRRDEYLKAGCSAATQGPLRICAGREYRRLADITVGSAQLVERVDYRGFPLDCRAPMCDPP